MISRAVVLAGLAVGIIVHEVTWPGVLVVAIIDRIGDTFFSPASVAALPRIVDDTQFEGAAAMTEARLYGAQLAGPSLGGILYGLARSVPYFGDAASYGVSVLTSFAMRGDFRPAKTDMPRRGLWSEAFEGVRFMVRDDLLRAVAIQAPLINFAFTGVLYTVILGMRHHGVAASVIGLTESGILAGGLLGAIVAARIQRRFTLQQLVVGLTAGGAVLMAVAAVLIPSPLVAAPLSLSFLLAPAANAALVAVSLRRTPESMRGRVNNAFVQAAMGLAALAPVMSGVLVAHVSTHWAMALFAVTLGVSAALAVSLRSLRGAEVVS